MSGPQYWEQPGAGDNAEGPAEGQPELYRAYPAQPPPAQQGPGYGTLPGYGTPSGAEHGTPPVSPYDTQPGSGYGAPQIPGYGTAGSEYGAPRPPAFPYTGQESGATPTAPPPVPQPAYPAYPPQQQYAVSLYGQAPYGQLAVAPKNPGLSLVASFFIPGLGTIINGDVGKGVGILVGYVACIVTSFLILPLLGVLGLWIWGMVDIYTGAQNWNRRHGIIS